MGVSIDYIFLVQLFGGIAGSSKALAPAAGDEGKWKGEGSTPSLVVGAGLVAHVSEAPRQGEGAVDPVVQDDPARPLDSHPLVGAGCHAVVAATP